ncbi:hypothetical protein C8R21_12446 [Nitrosospira multiformis]|uniref:Uncharacterized protein n=1 Tax=Nitrosospira multiformis TaxID=1231 RepID=A0A2T5I7A8_9PROT|nr:hypothetical protein C8R21_12446 [Nitrosospira multiformis]
MRLLLDEDDDALCCRLKYARAREERQSFSWGLCELETGESGEIFLCIRHLRASVVAISGTWCHAGGP